MIPGRNEPFTFILIPGVEHTNNAAERALRPRVRQRIFLANLIITKIGKYATKGGEEVRKICLIFHGPEVIDEGEAKEAIGLIKSEGFELEAALGGITGKTAVIDAEMQNIINISGKKKPSQVMEYFLNRGLKFIVLVNHAKNEESGFFLGEGILRNFIANRKAENLSFIQVEYSSRSIFRWRLEEKDEEVYRRVVKAFEFEERKVELPKQKIAYKNENFVYRTIRSVLPNEKILVNGVVIGISSPEGGNVTLVAREGRIAKIIGGTLIEHNLEKLSPLNLEEAMVKTVTVFRRTKPKKIGGEVAMEKREKEIACLFFNVENLFPCIEEGNITVAVTIGDDTTSIAGDILKRFDIRLIGITDGDADGLIYGIKSGTLEEYKKFLPEKSVVIRLKPGSDDVIGERIRDEVFKGNTKMEIEFKELKTRITELAKEDIIEISQSQDTK